MDSNISPKGVNMDPIIQLISLIMGFSGVVIAFITLYLNNLNNKRNSEYNMAQLNEKKHEDERKEIYKKLNEFYGPYQQLLETSRLLYDDIFKSNKPDNWRTLIALLEGEKLIGNDKEVYEQIMSITDELEVLRISKSGLVDDVVLQRLLAKAGTHYRIIKLAYNGKLTGEKNRFENYVYPKELNQMINEKIILLQGRLDELNTI
jgi:hypothetical protein